VNKVQGDFRQAEILANWNEHFRSQNQNLPFTLTKIRVVSISGFYVRQFIEDLGKRLELPALAYSIVRTKNGPFTREDC
jgi:tRNA U55 pseudouridine synthase TruB